VPKNSTVSSSQAIPLAESDECAKLLEKTLESYATAKRLMADLDSEIEKYKKLDTIAQTEINSLRYTVESLKLIIVEQQKLIESLSKNSKTKVKICLIC
jgi:hypothetical protein